MVFNLIKKLFTFIFGKRNKEKPLHKPYIIINTDKNGNQIHYKDSNGFESWKEYDDKNRIIHYRNSNGLEIWSEYTDSSKKVHHIDDSTGYEYFDEYDKYGNLISHKRVE